MEFEEDFYAQFDAQDAYQSYMRFQLDLEFVQMLANPRHLHCNFHILSSKILNFFTKEQSWRKMVTSSKKNSEII